MEIKISQPTKPVNSFVFHQETGFNLFQRENDFFLAGDASEAELLAAYEAHNPPAVTEPSVEDKLASAGLTLNDLKEALGL